MKPLFGMALFGLMALAISLVWAEEEDELRAQAERQQLAAQKADEAARLHKQAEELADQARQIEREHAEGLHGKEAEERERRGAELHERLSDLEQMRESVRKKLGEDHPQNQAITREIRVLEEELRELAGQRSGPEEETLEFERASLIAELEQQEKHMKDLTQTLSANHPILLKAKERLAQLQHRLQQKETEESKHSEQNAVRKIEHLHAAAEHLQQAGMPEMARELHQQAERIERELHQHHPNEAAPLEAIFQMREEMQDMRRAMEKLRDEVAELRQQLSRAKE